MRHFLTSYRDRSSKIVFSRKYSIKLPYFRTSQNAETENNYSKPYLSHNKFNKKRNMQFCIVDTCISANKPEIYIYQHSGLYLFYCFLLLRLHLSHFPHTAPRSIYNVQDVLFCHVEYYIWTPYLTIIFLSLDLPCFFRHSFIYWLNFIIVPFCCSFFDFATGVPSF